MSEVIGNIGAELVDAYISVVSALPTNVQSFVNFLSIVILVVLFSVFVWKFYKSVSTKNIIELDLNQYNTSKDAGLAKSLAVIFYVLEYMILLPILIFVWFAIFTLFLVFLTIDIPINTILILSATVIAAIRLTSYYKKQLSEDLAKLVPFTLLSVSLLTPTFFSIERIFNQFQDLSLAFGDMFVYLFFIISLEVILRFVDFVFGYFGLKEREDDEENKE